MNRQNFPCMSMWRLVALTTLVMVAFAANSLLCRQALKYTDIDPASFSTLRIVSGAAVLWLVNCVQNRVSVGKGSWTGAFALLIYVIGFSFAYLSLAAGTGALLLFGAVQLTMIMVGLRSGETLRRDQTAGLLSAIAGLLVLVLPDIEAPSLIGAILMLVSGIAWGIYSLLGRGTADPLAETAGHFLRAAPMAVCISLILFPSLQIDASGALYALLSGALTSGLGYVLWYRVLPEIHAIHASTVQLSVPLLASMGGMLLLDEPLTSNFLIASVLTLGGIWLVLRGNLHRP